MTNDQKELYRLLALMAAGDEHVFSQFYDATIKRTFGVIMRITGNQQLAEEVASDVYMQVWRSADKYDPDLAAPMTWVIMIARSRSLDALRRESSATRLQLPLIEGFDAVDEMTPGPFIKALDDEKRKKMRDLLAVLDSSERLMITLAFYRGMSHGEISEHTGKPLGSVKTILRRAQSVLRSAVKKANFINPMSHQAV